MNDKHPMSPPAGRFRILLVDGDPDRLERHRVQLDQRGFAVETARGADEALRRARCRRPDAILSDLLMPHRDGFGLCRRVRNDRHLESVAVILVGAFDPGASDRELAVRVGASALVARSPELKAEIDELRRSLPAEPFRDVRDGAGGQEDPADRAPTADERCRALFQHATDMITFLTPEGVVLDANRQSEEIFGIPAEQMIGRHIREFALPGHEETHLEGFRRAISQWSARRTVGINRPDGSIRHVEFSTDLVEINGRSMVLSIGRDVTDKVQAKEALSAAEEKVRSLTECLEDEAAGRLAVDGLDPGADRRVNGARLGG
jgi:PAS domain S-box-containing protein